MVSDTLSLEEVFRLLSPAEADLGRIINPTLYTSDEFRNRVSTANPFLRRVLSGKHIVLKGAFDGSIETG